MNKKYMVRLTAKERRTLREIIKKLQGVLLKADVAGPAWWSWRPLMRGWRLVRVTERRTKVDWAYALQDILNTTPTRRRSFW